MSFKIPQKKIDLLSGVKVLLNAHYIPGPVAAYLLKNLGAEVIKVEPPFGDFMRAFPPFIRGKDEQKMSAYFRTLNSGFKSIDLNFKDPDEIEIFRELVASSDILIDGNRAGYLTEKVLKDNIANINPEIVHIPITAYGLKGPMRDIAGHDNNILSLAGNLSYTSIDHDGLASIFGAQLIDITSGYLAALMGVTAIFGRKNVKSHMDDLNVIDVSMLHAASFLNQIYIAGMNVTQKSPKPEIELLNGGLPNYRMYMTSDKQSVYFGPIEAKLFKNFCGAVDRLDLLELLKQNKMKKLRGELELLFKNRSRKEWESTLEGVDCCFTPVNTLQEALENPQIKTLGLISETNDSNLGKIKLATYPAGFGIDSAIPEDCLAPAPILGEHTDVILEKILHYGPSDIQDFHKKRSLKKQGVNIAQSEISQRGMFAKSLPRTESITLNNFLSNDKLKNRIIRNPKLMGLDIRCENELEMEHIIQLSDVLQKAAFDRISLHIFSVYEIPETIAKELSKNIGKLNTKIAQFQLQVHSLKPKI